MRKQRDAKDAGIPSSLPQPALSPKQLQYLGWSKAYAKTEAAKLVFNRDFIEQVLVTPPELSSLDEKIEYQRKASEALRRDHYRNLYVDTLAPLAALAQQMQASPYEELSLTAEEQALVYKAIHQAEEIALEFIAVLKEEAFTDQWVRDLIKEWREEAKYGKTEKERKAARSKLNRIVTALLQKWEKGRPRVQEKKKRQTHNQATSRYKALSHWVKKFKEDKEESGDAEGACKRTLKAFEKSRRIKDPHQKSLIRQKLTLKLRELVKEERQ